MAHKTLRVEGGKALYEILQKLGPEVETRVMRGALNAGASVIGREARRRARMLAMSSRGKMRLAEAIRWRRARGRVGTVVAGIYISSRPAGEESRSIKAKFGERVGKARSVNNPRVWWRWIEFGTTSRFPKRQRSYRVPITLVDFRTMTHDKSRGRIQAQPFLRPAFDESHQRALQHLTEWAAKNTPKVAGRLARSLRAKADRLRMR